MARKALTSTVEDYLEAIYNIKEQKKVVRVKDIAKAMGVTLPTVSSMLNMLAQKGLITHEKYEYVDLTPEGLRIGLNVKQRHNVLATFLREILKIDSRQAEEDACRMEHAISPVTLEKLIDFMKFIEECPRSGQSWLKHFEEYSTFCKSTDTLSKEICIRKMKGFMAEYKEKIKEMERKLQ
ncbi:MAG: metal-dependent transcriptional regulator [Deltaproteobacteria bacterium]|nr:metal-dependent transcriptional regulator [Deltaproteobacteria bacterium]RLA91657.1 MAG: metal-dependent transcriptional regulator [Deltaproteobacteria bacterium]